MYTFPCVMLMLLTAALSAAAVAKEAEETFGCEANPTGDPIGGGHGYRDILTRGDFTVSTKADLLAALKQAKPGQVVFIPHGVEIELTGAMGVQLPGGVTLAGTRGLNGSPGARLFTQQRSGTQFVTAGDRGRVTGLRFEGPFAGVEKTARNATFLMARHFRTEVDNCEIYNWNIQGVYTALGASQVQVHHNYIHHCQRSGYGYGVVVYSSDVHIIANKFDYCRHQVAAGGRPGCSYEAAWNLIMPPARAPASTCTVAATGATARTLPATGWTSTTTRSRAGNGPWGSAARRRRERKSTTTGSRSRRRRPPLPRGTRGCSETCTVRTEHRRGSGSSSERAGREGWTDAERAEAPVTATPCRGLRRRRASRRRS